MKIGFFGLLMLILITLKLTNVITWSWWIVLLSPVLIWIGIVVILLTIYFGSTSIINKLKK